MINNEYELKIIISKNEYNELMKNSVEDEKQINYYFDTISKDILNSKSALRIREKNNKYTITYKTHNEVSEYGILDMIENNISISCEEFEQLLDNKISISKYIEIDTENKIEYIGKLITLRSKLDLDKNMPYAELDKSQYNNLTDYELEWEISKDAYSNSIKILKGYNIMLDNRRVGISKYLRFSKSLSI